MNKVIEFVKDNWIASALILVCLFGIGGLVAYKTNSKPVTVVETTAVTKPNPPTVAELLKLVNEERAKVGVAPLILDERLNKSAQQKSDDMLANDYFGHVDKNGRHGYDIAHGYAPDICILPSENITDNIYVNDSMTAFNAFKDSPVHYAAMINPAYTYTGYGIAGTKITEHFC